MASLELRMGLNKDISVRPTKNRQDGGAGGAGAIDNNLSYK